MKDKKIRLIVALEGGVVQAARADYPNVDLGILDRDDLEETEEAEEVRALQAEYERLPYATY